MPTRSMSGVRMHFWQVVTRWRGGSSWPRNHFFIGAMPELISRRLLSPFGTSGKLPRRRCPLLSKNERYFSRKSLSPVHSMFFLSSINDVGGKTKTAFLPQTGTKAERFRGTTQIAHYVRMRRFDRRNAANESR